MEGSIQSKHIRTFRRFLFVFIWTCSIPQAISQTAYFDLDSMRSEILSASDDEKQVYRILSLLQQFQQMRGTEILAYAEKARDLSVQYALKEKEAKANYFIAVGHYFAGRPEKGIEAAHLTRQILAESDTTDQELSDTYNLLTVLFGALDQTEERLYWAFENVKLCRETNDKDRLAVAYATLGNAYQKINAIDSAKKFWLEGLKLSLEAGDQSSSGVLYNNLGEITEDPDSALVYLSLASDIFKKLKYADGIAHSACNIGAAYLAKDQPDKALKFLSAAQQIWDSSGYEDGRALVRMRLARTSDLQSKYREGNQLFVDALYISKSKSEKIIQLNLLEEWITHKKKINQLPEAIVYYDQVLALKDSIFNEKRAKQVSLAEIRYQSEIKEKEIAEQKLELARQKNRQKTLILISLLVFSLTIGVLLFLRNRVNIKKERVEMALQLKEMESANLKKVDELKSTFFANLSHEFRTPITLIISPLEQIIQGTLKGDIQKYYQMMQQNARRLLRLVNQLLELSQLESGKATIKASNGDLAAFLRGIAYSFESLADQNDIEFKISLAENTRGYFDHDKIKNYNQSAFKCFQIHTHGWADPNHSRR